MRRSLVFAMCLPMLATACGAPSHHVATPTSSSQPAAVSSGPTALVATTEAWRLTAPRSRAAAVADGSRIFVLGGLAGGSSTASVLSIDPEAGTVVHAGTLAVAVHDTTGTLVAGAVRVFGGGSVGSTSDVQTYEPSGSRVSAHLPRARSDLAAVVVGDTTYIAGGFDGASLSPYVVASTDASAFRIAGTLATAVRYPAVAALGRWVFVIGGSTAATESSATGQVDLVQRFDTGSGRTTVVAHLPHALAHAAAFVLSGRLYVAGGVEGRTPLEAIYRIDGPTVQTAGRLPGPRSDAAVATIGDRAWLLGGENGGPSAPLDTVVSLRMSS